MIETEVKIKLSKEEFQNIFEKFKGAKFVNQQNIIYEIPRGFVRIRRTEKGKTLTLKKEFYGEFNSRKEIEFQTTSDLEILKEFLNELGLKESLDYSKRRADMLKNSCVVSLDILGENYYIEIEGNPEKIKQNLIELGLENHQLETKSYFELLR
jgi:adenylate cyclase class IV